MRRGRSLAIGPDDGKATLFPLVNAFINVRQADDQFRRVPVHAELVLDHQDLRRMIHKALLSKLQRSTDGPLTVRITPPPTEEPS
jgi:hypothetical protein